MAAVGLGKVVSCRGKESYKTCGLHLLMYQPLDGIPLPAQRCSWASRLDPGLLWASFSFRIGPFNKWVGFGLSGRKSKARPDPFEIYFTLSMN